MNICVVLVTFNRKGDLEKTLKAYETQSYPPRKIVVVDNHSTDGTDAMLAEWQKAERDIAHVVVSMPENVGGSGGFGTGLEKALELDCDWIFVSDDDAMPHRDTLEQLQRFAEAHAELVSECAAICGIVDNGEGYELGHRCRISSPTAGQVEQPVPLSEYDKPYFEVDFFSYIGTCIRKTALEKAGITKKELFIYSDDFEHALRVGKQGKMICVPKVVLCHKGNSAFSRDASWRDYYETRNVLLMYKEHFTEAAFRKRAWRRRLTGLRSLNPTKMKVIEAAIKDAKAGVTGLHPLYRPGWSPKKK